MSNRSEVYTVVSGLSCSSWVRTVDLRGFSCWMMSNSLRPAMRREAEHRFERDVAIEGGGCSERRIHRGKRRRVCAAGRDTCQRSLRHDSPRGPARRLCKHIRAVGGQGLAEYDVVGRRRPVAKVRLAPPQVGANGTSSPLRFRRSNATKAGSYAAGLGSQGSKIGIKWLNRIWAWKVSRDDNRRKWPHHS